MNLSIKKISLFMSGLFVLSPLAFASDDLGLRTLNNVKEIPLASNTDGYEYFYSNVFVSNGPHGLTNQSSFNHLMMIMSEARKSENLTNDGVKLYESLVQVKKLIGKKSSTTLTSYGANVVSSLGNVFVKPRLQSLLTAQDRDNKINIEFEYAGDSISLDTGEKFVQGMSRSVSENLEISFEENDNNKLLAFFNTSDYRRFLNSYSDLVKMVGKLEVAEQTKNNIDSILKRIFKKKYFDEMNHNGMFVIKRNLVKMEKNVFVKCLYEIYKFLPSENPRNLADFNKVMDDVIRPSERDYFSKLNNVELYYSYGPSFDTNQITSQQGKNFYKDFVETISNHEDDIYEYPMKLSFADSRALLTYLSFLMGDTIKDAVASENKKFDPIRGKFDFKLIIPQNSILVFDLYKNKENEILVRPSFNGKALELKKECERVSVNNEFYTLTNLNKCFDSEEKQ